ncbi:MAG: OmpA family protein [Bacteroidales bacterium]|nr:OmpA family protein [Bacteroidales bacterium]MDE7072194.1 OmpA family protein [Bacteroidales bacterium]
MKSFAKLIMPALLLSMAAGCFSCVSSKKYNELLDKQTRCAATAADLEKSNQECRTDLVESNALNERLQKDLKAANTQIDTLQRNYLLTAADLAALRKDYNKMDDKYKSTVSGKDALAEELSVKEQQLNQQARQLNEQAARLSELQGILDKKDQQLDALKEKVTEALVGFRDKGLSIHTKNGKVYVSMDEKLLFPSGSWTVNPQGREALYEIANVMAKDADIHVMVEGHTDDVPLKGKGDIKDNWDLSVKRATSIVKIILENKGINPANIMAAGRGEYVPLVSNDTPENRAKNRRTEIILTPNLDELFKILETN